MALADGECVGQGGEEGLCAGRGPGGSRGHCLGELAESCLIYSG